MSCADGTGIFIGFTVLKDFAGRQELDPGEKVVETQAYMRLATDAITVSSVVVVKSATAWDVTVESVESRRADDGEGSLLRMRKGCSRSNPTWSAMVEYNGEYPLEALVGAEGTIRRWNPDGSYREAYGWIAGAEAIPSQVPGEESVARMDFQWAGGKTTDAGYVKMYDASDVEQFPALPV